MKKLVSIILAIMLLISLAACGGKKSDAGYYIMDSAKEESSGKEMDAEDIKEFGLEGYIILNEDGTGLISLADGEPVELEWGKGKLKVEEEEVEYTVKGDILSFSTSGVTVNYKRSNEKPPVDK